MKMIKSITYSEAETGEIVGEQISKINIGEIKVPFKVGNSKRGKSSRFSKLFQMEDPLFSTGSYYQYFFKCLLHLEMSTNRIVEFTGVEDPNIPLNIGTLTELFRASERTTVRFINHCIKRDIIAKIRKNDNLYGYVINPIYALNGSTITANLYTLFPNANLDIHIPKIALQELKESLSVMGMVHDYVELK